MARKRLLINHVYYRPVGHALEDLKFARGFSAANRGLEVHLALNKKTPTELAEGAPWLKKLYVIDLDEVGEKGEEAACIRAMPKEWGYIATNYNARLEYKKAEMPEDPEAQGLLGYLDIVDNKLISHTPKGAIYNETRLPKTLKYKKTKLTLTVPQKASCFVARYGHSGLKICLLLGGSAGSRYYPSIGSWARIIREINREFSGAKIYITGVTRQKGGRTKTALDKDDAHLLSAKFDNVEICYDIGIWNQIALLKLCDVLVAPHTGFAFLASCVGTPWLSLSGGNWPEYFFNQTPFYSVLPDDPYFPYHCRGRYGDDNVARLKLKRIPSFNDSKLKKKIPEIISGIKLLLDKDFTYQRALVQNRKNIARCSCIKSRLMTKETF